VVKILWRGRSGRGRRPYTERCKAVVATLDAIKRLRASMRPQTYKTLDGSVARRESVPWYWRLVALGSSCMILGGFLMLPATFDSGDGLRVSRSVVGIFAVALLTAGFSFTALLCFAVRNPLFQADTIFLPALSSCAIGLLTVFYDFLISARYDWNTPALLVTIAASVSTIVYGGLLIYTHRRISAVKSPGASVNMIAPFRPESISSGTGLWQEPIYYENYVRNMFPASAHRPPPPTEYDSDLITEEEMQRQQMLMLLLQKEQPTTPDLSQSTFHIDWQGQESDDSPAHGYYAPQSAYLQTASHSPQPGVSRQWTGELRPWDGVWREPTTARGRSSARSERWQERLPSQEQREARRREIEFGR